MAREFRSPDRWHSLGGASPVRLREAVLQAHWAAQVLAAAGNTWVAKRPDDSHTSLRWSQRLGGLIGEPIARGRAIQCGLRLADLTHVLLDDRESVVAQAGAAGRSLDDALHWLQEAAAECCGSELAPLTRPDYEMPDHGIARGEAFAPSDDVSAELAHWYENAHGLLAPFVEVNDDALPPRCWPHHFDIATIVYLTRGDQRSGGPQVGVGLSPGDEHYEAPYLYVTPWPHPDDRSHLPSLPAGSWRSEGFFAAILERAEWIASSDQPETAAGFLNVAVEAAASLARSVR